jgi:hypothetical protein
MAQKTFHIELRCNDVDDPKKFDAVKRAVSRAASTLHAQATLICAGQSPPQIILYGEDFKMGKREIEMDVSDDGGS